MRICIRDRDCLPSYTQQESREGNPDRDRRDDEYRNLGDTPEENYLKLKEKRYHHHPDQEVAVYYLTGKNTLKVFLENGLNYLGIVL